MASNQVECVPPSPCVSHHGACRLHACGTVPLPSRRRPSLSCCSTSRSSTAADGSMTMTMTISKPHLNVALPSACAMQCSCHHHTHLPACAGQRMCCKHSTARRSNVAQPHPHPMPTHSRHPSASYLSSQRTHPVHMARGINSAGCLAVDEGLQRLDGQIRLRST